MSMAKKMINPKKGGKIKFKILFNLNNHKFQNFKLLSGQVWNLNPFRLLKHHKPKLEKL